MFVPDWSKTIVRYFKGHCTDLDWDKSFNNHVKFLDAIKEMYNMSRVSSVQQFQIFLNLTLRDSSKIRHFEIEPRPKHLRYRG